MAYPVAVEALRSVGLDSQVRREVVSDGVQPELGDGHVIVGQDPTAGASLSCGDVIELTATTLPVYVVEPGDTWASIADAHQIAVEDLLDFNKPPSQNSTPPTERSCHQSRSGESSGSASPTARSEPPHPRPRLPHPQPAESRATTPNVSLPLTPLQNAQRSTSPSPSGSAQVHPATRGGNFQPLLAHIEWRERSVDRSSFDDPFGRLSGHVCDVVEIGVVVNHDE